MLTVTEILITDLVPLRYRGGYMGIVSSMWALGSVAGPIMGGGFAQNVTWRWILWINLPFAGVSFVMIPLFLKLNQRVEGVGEKLRRVDWVGVVVFVGSMTAVLIPITWGGVMYDWGSWRTVVPLVVGFVGLIGFAVWEIYGAKEPMIALEVFMNRTAAGEYHTSVPSPSLPPLTWTDNRGL